MSADQLAWVAAVVVAATTVQAALGFGASLVVVSLGALRVPIGELLPVLVPVSCLATGTILAVDRAHVRWPLLLGRVLPLMAPGVVVGALLAERLSDDLARRVYGALLVVLAGRALLALRRPEPAAAARPPRGAPAWLLAAGLVHGVYATGGPLLVYVIDRLRLPPRAFRATLAGVWLTLNVVLTAGFAARGRLDAGTATCSLALVPALAVGLLLGHRVHVGLDPRRLRLGVLGLLVVVGVSLAS